MNIQLNTETLMGFLKEKNLAAQLDERPNQIQSALSIGGHDFPLFVKVDPEMDVLQLILFLPFAMKPESINDVARLLHLFNKELDVPGFGLDESSQAIFYRCTLPGTEGHVDGSLLDKFLTALPKIGYAFFPTVASVANGNAKFETIAKKMKR